MPISIECEGCGFTASVPDAFAGRTAKCKRCGSRVTVPEPAAAAVASLIPELDHDGVDFPTVEVDEEGADLDIDDLMAPRHPHTPGSAIRVNPQPSAMQPTRDLGKEPWYYGFVAGYAHLILCVGVVAGSIWAGGVIVASIASAKELGPETILALLAGLIPSVAVILISMLVAAPILLAVDAARTLRAIRAGR